MAQKLLRLLGCLLFALLFALPTVFGQETTVFGQERDVYKNLFTAINTTVYDTISGINLDINESNPQAKHGDVNIRVVGQGGSGKPYIFEIAYIPEEGYVGVDSFVLEYRYASTYPYLIYRGFRTCVMPSLLRAAPDFATTSSGVPVAIDVLSNDTDPSGSLSVSHLPLVNNGAAIINSDGEVVFTPEPGFLGIAHVQYSVCDALNFCQTSTIHIGVNNGAPSEEALRIFTKKDQLIDIPLDFEGYTIFQAPAHGVLSLHDGAAFQYAPKSGFHGSDHFVLKNTFNGVDFFKSVHVTVLEVVNANYMAMDDLRFAPKDRPITFNVRDNDIGNLLVRNWSVPDNFPGTLSGTNGIGDVTFSPDPGFSGLATFYYKIGNAAATALEMATVTIIVDNFMPKAGFPYHLTTPKATPFVVKYDIPFSGFNFSIAGAPEHGSLESFPGYSEQLVNGQQVSGHNLVVYTPEADYIGEDAFALLYCAPNGECQITKMEMSVIEIDAAEPPFCVMECTWPGDANLDGITNNKDLLPMGYVMGLQGVPRVEASMDWYGQNNSNWNILFSELPYDLKHIDADGNGIINKKDIAGISESYNKVHNLYPKSFEIGKGLPFFLKLLTPNPKVGDLVQLEILLGNEFFPAIDIYGFTFDISLGKGLVDSAFNMTFLDNSWLNLNSPSISLAERPSIGQFEVAFSRTNGQPASGQGVVGIVEFVIIDIVDGGGQNNRAGITLNPTIMLADGSTSTGDPIILELPIQPQDRSSNLALEDRLDLSLYPSPTKDMLYINWYGNEHHVEALSLLDLHGKLLLEQNVEGSSQASFDLSDMPSGIYIVAARTDAGVISRKVQVLR